MNKISCVYYPTTVILIDDNETFLENTQLAIGSYTPCLRYADPQEALKNIRKEIKRADTLRNVIAVDTGSEYYSHQSNQLPLHYNISDLYKHAYKKNHFSEVSVIVLDYEMPNMNGEAVCEELKGSPIKIIMLTGEADESMAVKLFNAGLIDKFILKGQPGLAETLKNSIAEMQKRYFQNLTDSIVKGLVANEDSSLGDPFFIHFFNQVCHELSISSYYLIELSGSFLLLDDRGMPTWLIIKTQRELEEMATQLIEAEPSSKRIELMRAGEMIPYFSGLDDYFNPKKVLSEKYWHECIPLKGNKNYSYALVKELPDFHWEQKKVCSFNDYLMNIS